MITVNDITQLEYYRSGFNANVYWLDDQRKQVVKEVMNDDDPFYLLYQYDNEQLEKWNMVTFDREKSNYDERLFVMNYYRRPSYEIWMDIPENDYNTLMNCRYRVLVDKDYDLHKDLPKIYHRLEGKRLYEPVKGMIESFLELSEIHPNITTDMVPDNLRETPTGKLIWVDPFMSYRIVEVS